MQEEIWKDIPGWEGAYQASSIGRVKSMERRFFRKDGTILTVHERILIPGVQNKGYEVVVLCNGVGRKMRLVHQLVASAFIPNPENKPFVDHINGNRRDNSIENLRWCTPKENNNFELAKIHASQAILGKKGIDCPNSKKVSQYSLSGRFIRSFYGTLEAKRITGISNISRACLNPNRTAGGYKWKYEE